MVAPEIWSLYMSRLIIILGKKGIAKNRIQKRRQVYSYKGRRAFLLQRKFFPLCFWKLGLLIEEPKIQNPQNSVDWLVT